MTHDHAMASSLPGISGWVTLACVLVAATYLGALRRYGPLFHPAPGDRAASAGQVGAFLGGLMVLWVALGSPLHPIGEGWLFSMHLLQHLLLALAAPPLLLLGLPRWMAEILVRPEPVRRVLLVVTRPWLSVSLFALVLLGLHLPGFVAAMAASGGFHGAAHLLLFVAGGAVWLPLVSPVPAFIARPGVPARLLTLFAVSIVPTVPASVLSLASRSPYVSYGDAAAVYGLTPLQDVWAAGLIAKLGGGVALWLVATVMFFRWAAQAERRERSHTLLAAATDPAGPALP